MRETPSAWWWWWVVCVYVYVCTQGGLSEKVSGEDATQDVF